MALRTVYCVQAYGRRGKKHFKGQLRQFGSPDEATGVGEQLARRVAGVVVYSVKGDPAFDYWEEPRLIQQHGDVPQLEVEGY